MRLSKARRACVEAMMKDTIFDAAGALLEEKGADGLTMDGVASRVGVATASLYNYFRDKNDLLQYTYNRMVEPFLPSGRRSCQGKRECPAQVVRDRPDSLGTLRQAQGANEALGGDGV